MKPTMPEDNGLIDREKLYAMSGRSRKPQMALAKELGLTAYAQPAGGCLLTDPIFSFRLRELLSRTQTPSMKEVQLLRVGRHFRAGDGAKIIVGRDERDNQSLQKLAEAEDYLLHVTGNYGSPLVLAEPGISEQGLNLAAALCARYSGARTLLVVPVKISRNEDSYLVEVPPAENAAIERLRIHPPSQNI
jgi:hypothetical protein